MSRTIRRPQPNTICAGDVGLFFSFRIIFVGVGNAVLLFHQLAFPTAPMFLLFALFWTRTI